MQDAIRWRFRHIKYMFHWSLAPMSQHIRGSDGPERHRDKRLRRGDFSCNTPHCSHKIVVCCRLPLCRETAKTSAGATPERFFLKLYWGCSIHLSNLYIKSVRIMPWPKGLEMSQCTSCLLFLSVFVKVTDSFSQKCLMLTRRWFSCSLKIDPSSWSYTANDTLGYCRLQGLIKAGRAETTTLFIS